MPGEMVPPTKITLQEGYTWNVSCCTWSRSAWHSCASSALHAQDAGRRRHVCFTALSALLPRLCLPVCALQHGHYTAKAEGMQAVRQFVPPNTLR